MKLRKKIWLIFSLLVFSAIVVAIVILAAFYINLFWLIGIFLISASWVAGIILFLQKRNETTKITWMVIIICIPIIGTIIYFVFGHKYFLQRKIKYVIKHFSKLYAQENWDETNKLLTTVNKEKTEPFLFGINLAHRAIQKDTKVDVFTPIEWYNQLITDLKNAKKSIYLNFFIMETGQLLDRILDLLIEKSKQNIDVKIIYDDVGSYFLLQKITLTRMRNSKIKFAKFAKVSLPFMSGQYNYRNHRKDVIIDNQIAYTGGINLGDNYFDLSKKFGMWRDIQIRLDGLAVKTVNLIFIQDWLTATGEDLNKTTLANVAMPIKYNGATKNEIIQVLDSGPHTEEAIHKDLIISLISKAKKRVWLSTPYFLPTADLITALKNAALSGVDVRIFMPGLTDKWMVLDISRTYYLDLLPYNVRFFELNHTFNHAKVGLFDDDLAYVGTCNLDLRSFFSDYQTLVLVKGINTATKIETFLKWNLAHSTEVFEDLFDNKSFFYRKVFLKLVKIFIPLL